MRHPVGVLFLLLASLVGCDDDLGPANWVARTDTVTLYSLSRPELLGQPAALDFVLRATVRVEAPDATGAWDLAVGEEDGELAWFPPGVVQGVQSSAAITEVPENSLDAITRAPRDTGSYHSSEPLQIRTDRLYVARSRGIQGCVYYAKLEPIEVNASQGSVRLAFVSNPNCGDRALVPPGG